MSNRSRFRSASGCAEVWFAEPPAFTKGKKPRGSKRAGYTFERKVGELLYKKFGDKVWSNVWIGYEDVVFGERVCSPDHLIVDVEKGWITIVECKLSHTKDAWRQINDVYWHVVRSLFPGFKVRGIEVCKNFEMSAEYPVRPRIVCGWDEYFEGGDNVMVCGL
jgi:hypothetical protein